MQRRHLQIMLAIVLFAVLMALRDEFQSWAARAACAALAGASMGYLLCLCGGVIPKKPSI